ncbi:hypothetical protein [Paraburkholderia acidiphila]|uniref:Uncharacterized protein n=1 Tax=Paraburkholderia acidiphila TaxID=2571747 RepID=A0A7Z2JC98_9BURK|nr:hypothetical protein [Paraburkholderia acidiphila]QGZ59842.1 hypothetical protein FAZ97_33360 [Paraburkholderia acidiphila]
MKGRKDRFGRRRASQGGACKARDGLQSGLWIGRWRFCNGQDQVQHFTCARKIVQRTGADPVGMKDARFALARAHGAIFHSTVGRRHTRLS